MKKVFIAYGSGVYLKSLQRIGEEARALGLFSKVILYTEKDLPAFIQASPLKAYGRGDGYWVWKPYLIWKTMQDYPDCIVVYADCGCVLQPNMEEWKDWFGLLETYDTLTFQYRLDYVYPWQQGNDIKTIDAEWTKESLIAYFDPLIGNREWIYTGQCMGGIVLSCRNSALIKMWLDIALMRPDLLMDCFGNEIEGQRASFRGHRHDQSVLSALSAYWSKKGTVVKVLLETAESKSDAAILATRRHTVEVSINEKTRIIGQTKKIIGGRLYGFLHRRLKNNSWFQKKVFELEHKNKKIES